ncbi:response regulator [Dyadobacter sp. CY323]|uniref:response regulator n=1 Tax=Dyadobacter sp. CY323 TaxID=2907302 RepID=UPI001F4308EA|nr:response regulator [Dyadobacter sp. CY323]MCE6992948.1 response regulator [Dyadobacter sp. CY323]
MQKEIYLVEDSSDFRQLIRTIFNRFLPTYNIRSFQGAQELYQYMVLQSADDYAGRRPALIILDLKMHMIDGFELLKLVRQTPPNATTEWNVIPVVMLSAAANQEDINKCYQAGANSFFVKPIDFEELRELLATICRYWVDYNCLASATPSSTNSHAAF